MAPATLGKQQSNNPNMERPVKPNGCPAQIGCCERLSVENRRLLIQPQQPLPEFKRLLRLESFQLLIMLTRVNQILCPLEANRLHRT